MALIDALRRLRSRVRPPRRTVRLRLTLLYGGLFLIAGIGLLAITYVLVGNSKESNLFVKQGRNGQVVIGVVGGTGGAVVGGGQAAPGTITVPATGDFLPPSPEQLRKLVGEQHAAQLHQLLVQSGIALAVMSVFAIGLGWLVAGRVLRPLQTMTAAVKTMSATNLDERLALQGPRDEMRDLGDTFDELLDRLEASFEAQRQFVANASHELRTPLARQRTLGEVALRDPRPTIESLRTSHERMLAAGEQQERLIDALLTLAHGERGLERREPVDLGALAAEALLARRSALDHRGLHVHESLEAAVTSGDPNLVERLVTNVVDNAVRHSSPGGRVEVVAGVRGDEAILSVVNDGLVIRADEVEGLFEPFRRLGRDRTTHGDGFGLGLSIVRAIATAHGATVAARPGTGGGLEMEVRFAAAGQGRPPTVDDAPGRMALTGDEDLDGSFRRDQTRGTWGGPPSGPMARRQ